MTNYTKEECLQISATFKEAKKHLLHSITDTCSPRSKTRYICFAIEETGNNWATRECKKIIGHRLGMHLTYESWIQKNFDFATIYKDVHENSSKKMQKARHAWLNSLIKEFSV
jgi:hypothetical protein